jgi:hypothetical protein
MTENRGIPTRGGGYSRIRNRNLHLDSFYLVLLRQRLKAFVTEE